MSQSKKQKELLNECLSFISFIQYQETQGDELISESVKELAASFKENLERYPNPDFWLTQSSWDRLSNKLNSFKYENKIDSINKNFHAVKQSKYPNRQRTYPLEKSFVEMSAKELLNKRRYNQFYDNDGGEEESANQEKIQTVLKNKEHVLKPSQSRLIRKMSIHAGKKLSLQAAQLLNNKLKKKEQN